MSAGSWERLLAPTAWKHAGGIRGFFSTNITRDEAIALGAQGAARLALERFLTEWHREDPSVEGLLMFVHDGEDARVGFGELSIVGSELRWTGPRLR
jgi:hypothetical protein